MPTLTMDQGGCINTVSSLVGIDWSAIPWATTGTDGTRAARATVKGTLQGEDFAVDSVVNETLPTPTPGKVPYLVGAGYSGVATPQPTDPKRRVNLRVTIRVPEQDQQIAAVFGPDWAAYVFVDPVFTLVL